MAGKGWPIIMNGKIILTLILLIVIVSTVECQSLVIRQPTTLPPAACHADGDCTLIIRVDVCCSCPEVRSFNQMRTAKGYEVYTQGENYGLLRPSRCEKVDCPVCPSLPAGLTCDNNQCRTIESPEEILTVCPNCFQQAAESTYRLGNFKQAIDLCSQTEVNQQYDCFADLFDLALSNAALDEAEHLCKFYLEHDAGDCLRRIAGQLTTIDLQKAVYLCHEIDVQDVRHFSCILNVAQDVKSQNRGRALEICSELPPDQAELCKQELLK